MLVERRPQRKVEWPGGARVALLLTVDLEAEEDLHPFPNGKINYKDFSTRQYGGRCGVWRVLEILDRHNIKATFFICGAAVENYPEASKAIKARGHDVAAHTYHHEYLFRLNEEEEREVFHKTIAAFETVLGERPYGWRGCFISERSLGLSLEYGFKWESTQWNDDLPSVLEEEGKRMVEIPFLFHNDVNFLGEPVMTPSPTPLSSGKLGIVRNATLAWQDEFDACYERGATTPTMLTICVHPYLIGRPGPSKALDDFLAYTKKFVGVWYGRYTDVANWWLEQGEFI